MSAAITRVLSRLRSVQRSGHGWVAQCPAHDDKRPSLSINIGDEQRVLMKCHAGCALDNIVTKLGLETKDLFEREEKQPFLSVGKQELVAIYDYRNAASELIYQVLRFAPKGFRQRRPDPATPGAWKNDLTGVEPLLYRLDKIQGKKWLCVTEGEKDADALVALGLAATTNSGGALQWKEAHTRQLMEVHPELIALFEHNDDSGLKRTGLVATACLQAGLKVKVITAAELGGLPQKGDISDWITAGHTRDELIQIIKTTRLYVMPARIESDPPRLLTVAEAHARIGVESEWLVDKMLAVGDMSLWVAKPGVGKSALLRQLARSVSVGAPFLGRATRQGQIVYLALEGARATINHLLRLGHDPRSDQILVWIDDVESRDPVRWLRETLAHLSPALIVVDCLFDFTRVDDSANSGGYGAIYAALGPVLRYAQERRTHIALIHHASKKADQSSIDAALGSTGITGKPGTVLTYRLSDPADPDSRRILACSKHRAGDREDLPDVVLEWNRDSQTLSVAGLHRNLVRLTAGLAVIKEVGRTPGMTRQGLLAELGGRRQTAISAIQALRDLRVLDQDGRGTRQDPATFTLSPSVADPEATWRAFCADSVPSRSREREQNHEPIWDFVPAVPTPLGGGGTESVSSPVVSKHSVPAFLHTRPPDGDSGTEFFGTTNAGPDDPVNDLEELPF